MCFELPLFVLFISSCDVCYCLIFFISTWKRSSFTLSCRADLLAVNSLIFLSVSLLMSPWFLKESVPDIEFLVDIFSFSTLNTSSHCLLAFMVSSEQSAVNLTKAPLYRRSHFSCAFKIPSFSVVFNSSIVSCKPTVVLPVFHHLFLKG